MSLKNLKRKAWIISKVKLFLVYLNIFVKAYGAVSTASWYLRWQFWFQTWTHRACPSRRPIGWPPVGLRRPPCTVDRPGCSRSPGRGGSIPGLASQSPAGLSTTSQQRILIIRFCHARQWYHCERAQIKITWPWCYLYYLLKRFLKYLFQFWIIILLTIISFRRFCQDLDLHEIWSIMIHTYMKNVRNFKVHYISIFCSVLIPHGLTLLK